MGYGHLWCYFTIYIFQFSPMVLLSIFYSEMVLLSIFYNPMVLLSYILQFSPMVLLSIFYSEMVLLSIFYNPLVLLSYILQFSPMVLLDPFVLNHNTAANVNVRTRGRICYEFQQADAKFKHDRFYKMTSPIEMDWGMCFLLSRDRIRTKTQAAVNELQQVGGLVTTKCPFAELFLKLDRTSHVTPFLQRLHWLPISYRILFKYNLITFKAIKFSQPTYLSSLFDTSSLTHGNRLSLSSVCPLPIAIGRCGQAPNPHK